MSHPKITDLKICDTCPWLKKNHGKRHPAGWYRRANLRRLWNGIRSGEATGMICHSTDPAANEYGGAENIKDGKKAECGGFALLFIQNINAASNGLPQPIQPGLKVGGMRTLMRRWISGLAPTVEDRRDEVGVPWQ